MKSREEMKRKGRRKEEGGRCDCECDEGDIQERRAIDVE